MRISDWSSDVCSSDLKLRLIGDYLRSTPDPDRGWAMAALTGDLDIKAIKPALIRALIEDRVDPVLFRMSCDYVGATAETVALLWHGAIEGDRKSQAVGKRVSVRVVPGGRRIIKNK